MNTKNTSFSLLILGSILGIFTPIHAGKTCGLQYNISPKIVGGEDFESIDEFPFSVSIQIRDSGSWWQECGGAFLTDKFILTAAHCANNGYVPYRAVFGCKNVTSIDCQIVYFGYEDWTLHET